jgi:AcrR family transcriptional regulator
MVVANGRGGGGIREEQRRALELMVSGTSIAETARRVGVDRTTIYYWLKKDAAFVAAYNQWKEILTASCQARFFAMAERASATVEAAVESDPKLAWAVLKELKMMNQPPAVPSQSTDPEIVRRHMEMTEVFEGKLPAMGQPGNANAALKGLLEMAEGKMPNVEE